MDNRIKYDIYENGNYTRSIYCDNDQNCLQEIAKLVTCIADIENDMNVKLNRMVTRFLVFNKNKLICDISF